LPACPNPHTPVEDTIALFRRATAGLRDDGIIMVKENICREGFIVDKDDNSLTRSNAYMLDLFRRAGMSVAYNIRQRNFPKELFEVRMYVLRPGDSSGDKVGDSSSAATVAQSSDRVAGAAAAEGTT
jgi:AdoMet dependent proline di-methyltransferase